MVVKAKRGRRRYIALRSLDEGQVPDDALYAFLNSSLGRHSVRFKVIQFDGRTGIVRVSNEDQHRAIEVINSAGTGHWETTRTSGTLRTLREGYLN